MSRAADRTSPRSGDVRRVAWAQNRGVRAVEVRIDDRRAGHWQPAQLGASYSNETWRLWSFPWQADQTGPAHDHGAGHRQHRRGADLREADVMPDGATGWHTVSFAVK